MKGLGSSEHHRDSVRESRQLGAERRGGQRRSSDARNCAQWFARFEEPRTEPTRPANRDQIRLLEEKLEAVRRLVTGEQIP